MFDISGLTEIGDILLTEEQIDRRVSELAEQITADYAGSTHPLILIGILKGSVFFMTDLARRINLPLTFDFLSVSSYGSSTQSSGDVRILKDLDQNIEGADVIIVEDIIDTGYTLKYLRQNIESRGVHSLRIATLLNKPERRIVEVEADYCGFKIPDEFVVGYGLDFAQKYRNLPFIGIVKREAYM